jgi:hypothetical protein
MQGHWLGETYLAFLDFVTENGQLGYCVVDMDWGCGVVSWKSPKAAEKHVVPISTSLCMRADDGQPGYAYYDWQVFDQQRREFLNLKSIEDFIKDYRVR